MKIIKELRILPYCKNMSIKKFVEEKPHLISVRSKLRKILVENPFYYYTWLKMPKMFQTQGGELGIPQL